MYALQVQEDGTLSSTMQQIVLVTDPAQLVALQQLAQQGQLETLLAGSNSLQASAAISTKPSVQAHRPKGLLHCKTEEE